MKKVSLLFFVAFFGLAYSGYSQTTKSKKSSISSEKSIVQESTPQTELKKKKALKTENVFRAVSDIEADITKVEAKIESHKSIVGFDMEPYEDELKKLKVELRKTKNLK